MKRKWVINVEERNVRCKICNNIVRGYSQFINGECYHNHCIEELESLINMLRKNTKTSAQAIMYYGKQDNESEITLVIDSMLWEFMVGICVCDLCNSTDDEMYFCPELGSKLICSKCFKDHTKHVKWYTEDIHAVLNNLILFIQSYEIQLDDKSKQVINEFFADKGHSEFTIERFIKEE